MAALAAGGLDNGIRNTMREPISSPSKKSEPKPTINAFYRLKMP